MGQYPDLVEMCAIATEWLEGSGVPEPESEARALLEALGIPDLVRDLATAERVVVAADGFHPVARFFAAGSDEEAFITSVLHRVQARDRDVTP